MGGFTLIVFDDLRRHELRFECVELLDLALSGVTTTCLRSITKEMSQS